MNKKLLNKKAHLIVIKGGVNLMVAKKKSKPKVRAAKNSYSDITDGLKYPWNNAARLWNILWGLIPILGWLALMGYVQKIVQTLVKGDKSGLPEFGEFWENTKNGFWVFVKLIPLFIVLSVISWIPYLGKLAYWFLAIFFVPYILIRFLDTGEFRDTFNYQIVIDDVFGDISNYLVALLKTIVYSIVYWLLSFVLVGIPCLYFGNYYFLAEFYRNKN
ncbi:DUF4013 domain-containing protein [Candidatus Woesearchaeota archaeon]|nr:MAG: DUF4013 domain-containing protein [Candidatus Woesearchaeota archaeon]